MEQQSNPSVSVIEFRRRCAQASLTESDVDPNPFTQFTQWFQDALQAELPQPNAMSLATATPDGIPSARMVLLKDFDEQGFTFYTNYDSQKGRELARNPQAALVFYWAELSRQVRIIGRVSQVTPDESDVYWRTRPVDSRLGALASQQSQVIRGREVLEAKLKQLQEGYQRDDIPRPSNWGGYRVSPRIMEFWHSRENRLHDRLRYTRQPDNAWLIERLSP
ncbi:MAG: pyridoxamine 5'-phosphate oxidase [Candidatus Entotheonellia bacterium]